MNLVLKSYLVALLVGVFFIGTGLYVVNLVKADTASTTVDVGNATPSVTAVSIEGGSANKSLTNNAQTDFTITATISDNNGCEDVFTSGTISGAFYRSGVANGSACSDDAANCYPSLSFVEQNDSCSGGTSGDAVATTSVWFFADATDASSTFSAENWLAAITAADESGASASSTDDIEIDTSIGLDVQQSTIDFAADSGALAPNTTSTLTDIARSTTTVDNIGNDNIDLELNVGDLTKGGDTIVGNNEKWASSSLGYESLTNTGSSTDTTINLAQTATSTASSSQNTFWGLTVPNGQATGTYSGTNTFTAIWSSD